jgi:hypothetical protein
LSLQSGVEFVSERAPMLGRSRFQAAQGADGALARTLGSLHRLHQQVVGVGFPFVDSGSFANVHSPLHLTCVAVTVNINVSMFSHYFHKITKPMMKRNELDKNSGVFLRNSQK